MDEHSITSGADLEAVLGEPTEFVSKKVSAEVTPAAAEFIGRSPLVFVATSDAHGALDVSPKGDAPGFVEVDGSSALLIPERLGNKLAYGFRNILATGRIGLIFVVPGVRETLRANGTATVTKDPELLDRLGARGKPALLATRVTVEECFFHCGKAMIRSQAWKPETWGEPGESLLVKDAVDVMADGDTEVVPLVEAAIEQNYVDELY